MSTRLTPLALTFVVCACWGQLAAHMGVPTWLSLIQSLVMGMAIGEGVER